MLKTLKFLFAFALILSLTACGDDEDDTMTSTDLVGVWDAQSFDALSTSTTIVSGMSFTTITEIEGIHPNFCSRRRNDLGNTRSNHYYRCTVNINVD